MSKRRPSRLPRWQELAIYAGFGMLLITGLAWLALDNWVRVAGEFGPEPHPAERVMLIAHGVGAYAFLALAGMLVPVHIPLGWRQGRNRTSGAVMIAIVMVLALTALALYYFSGDIARHWVGLVHWIIGAGAPVALAVHVILGRRAARTD